MAFLKRRYIIEADDDNQTGTNGGQTANQPSGNDSGNTENNVVDNNADSGNDNQNDQESSGNETENDENETDDNAEDEDYSIDSDPDEDEDSNDEGNDDEDYSSDDDMNSNDDDSSDDSDSEEKQMDRDMFSTLSEDEQKRKIATLKRLYIDLYSKADDLIEKFNQVGIIEDENFGPIIKRILSILYDMKEYVSYYILNIFDNSSYIENDITFNRYLAILNGIKLAVNELAEEEAPEDDKKKSKE